MIVDHHEYGPSLPPVYDDDLLYLWPRNLNVDSELRAAAKAFCLDYVKADSEAAGYSADEYGLAKVGPNVGPVFLPAGMPTGAQTAGDWDDGIARNAGGLRNTMGILVESAVSARAWDSGGSGPAVMQRRVESQRVVMDATVLGQAEGNTGGTLTGVLGLHEVQWTIDGEEAVFPMAQPSKNVIPLLLDSRAERSTADGTPVY